MARRKRSELAKVQEPKSPDPERFKVQGNIALLAEHALVEVIAERPAFQDAVKEKLAAVRADVTDPDASPLERLLVDRVALCWLQVHTADLAYAVANKEGSTLTQGEYYDRRLDRAQRRYLRAIRTLAQVRRLLGPTVQVNIAKQQVNVAQ